MKTLARPQDFAEGIHWKRFRAAGKPWKAVTLCDIFIPVQWTVRFQKEYSLRQRGREWGRIVPKGVIVREGYAWNFCSSSPDWEKAASLPHDLLYQFSGCPWFPGWLDRHAADDMFAELSVTRVWFAYRFGLWLGSWACWGKPPREGETVVVEIPD